MGRAVIQIAFQTDGGGLAPLAVSRDPALVREVAQHILRELQAAKCGDPVLDELTLKEAHHLGALFKAIGVRP